MRSLIRKILKEEIVNNKIVCDNCGWSWNIKDGKKDLYTCHKCGHDNTPKKELSNLRKTLDNLGRELPNSTKNLDYLENFIKDYVEKNNFVIKFLRFCPYFTGVRTKNQIIVCSPSEMSSLGDFLYVIFHEMRHEQQISQIKMENPLSDYDLEDFEKIYNQYWEMELDADQFAKNMISQLVGKMKIPIDVAKKLFRLSDYIKQYSSQSASVRGLLKSIIEKVKQMKKEGLEYTDIQDHPIVKQYLDRLENFL